jgi:putative endonuclease
MDATHRLRLDPAIGRSNGQPIGRLGEDLAARHLVDDDRMTVVARNWRLTAGELRGELDLVALDPRARLVVVCEVKTRRDAARFGGALAAVSPRKRAKIRALTGAFLREASLPYGRVRLDVIAIDLGREPVLHHVLGAL